jgi:hypothetical protein
MHTGDILAHARYQLDDETEPYLWSDIELLAYLQKAYDEWCRKLEVLRDAETVSICSITLLASTSIYSMSEKIVRIFSARLATSTTVPLDVKDELWLDEYVWAWRTRTGTPLYVAPDYETKKIRVVPYFPVGSSGDTLWLSVARLGLSNFTIAGLETESPETNSDQHILLVDGILRDAYLKRDTECYYPKSADRHRLLFEQSKSDAMSGKIRLRHSTRVLRPNAGMI